MPSSHDLDVLHRVLKRLVETSHTGSFLQDIAEQAMLAVGADAVLLLLEDRLRSHEDAINHAGLDRQEAQRLALKAGAFLASRRFPLEVVFEDSETPEAIAFGSEGMESMAAVPVLVNGSLIGHLMAFDKGAPSPCSGHRIPMLEILAALAGLCVTRRLSGTDWRRGAKREDLAADAGSDGSREEAREETKLLRAIIDNLPDIIYAKDRESRFILGNHNLLHVMGADRLEDLLGKTDFDFYPQEMAQQYRDDEIAVISNEEPLINREEPNINCRTGEHKWLLTSKIPHRDQHGNVVGLIGIGHDITEQKRAQEALHKRNRELATLNQLSNQLYHCQSEAETYGVITRVCSQLFPQDSGCLRILNTNCRDFNLVSFWGESASFQQVISFNDCPLGFRRSSSVVLHFRNDDICGNLCDSSHEEHLCAPILLHGNILGTMHIMLDARESDLSDEEHRHNLEAKQAILKQVIDHYSLFLGNLRLREALRIEAIHDPLTGLFNRRHMEASLDREEHRANRHGMELGIIMLDIDHFKAFNDRYGHDAGDRILELLGNLLHCSVRGEDIACRYGGEEFLLIMSGAPRDVVRKRSEELQQKIRAIRISHKDMVLGFRVSMGVAMFSPGDASIRDVVKKADNALYTAKSQGRDRIEYAWDQPD